MAEDGVTLCRSTSTQPVLGTAPGISSQHDLTLENTMFPFLFPFGRAAFNGAMKLSNYIRYRFRQLFSIFMLYNPYLLIMYQIKMASEVLYAACHASACDLRQRGTTTG